MTIIKISSANLLPFGLLSNHYPYEFSIDDSEYKKKIIYNNVSQYIYENMIPYDVYYRTIIKNTKPEKMYQTFMDYARKIHNKKYLELLKRAFDKKLEDAVFRRSLLDTKNKKIYYINPNNLLLGMKIVKSETDIENGLNVLGKTLENIRFQLQQKYNEDKLYEAYVIYKILEIVINEKSNFTEYIDIINENENSKITFEKIKQIYGDKIKYEIPLNILSIISEPTLNNVLKVSIDNPIVLVHYVLKKNLRTYRDRLIEKLKNDIFNIYINHLIEKKKETFDVPEDMTFEEYKTSVLLNELNYVKTYNIKNVVYDLYDSRKLDPILLEEIDKLIDDNNYEIPNDENIDEYENFNIDDFNNEDNKEDEDDEDDDIIINDYSSIYSIYAKSKFVIDDVEYGTVFDFINTIIKNELPFSPYVNKDKSNKKFEELADIALGIKFEYDITNNRINENSKRHTIDLYHILNLLNNNKYKDTQNYDNYTIYHVDENPYLGGKFQFKNKFEGENYVGKYLKKIINLMDYNLYGFDRYYASNVQDRELFMTQFVENDLFMKQWVINKTTYMFNIVLNVVQYMNVRYSLLNEDKDILHKQKKTMLFNMDDEQLKYNTYSYYDEQKKGVFITRRLVKNILNNIYSSQNNTDIHMYNNVPDFFVDLLRTISKNFKNFDNKEYEVISYMWSFVLHEISLTNTLDQNLIKNYIYKMQLILSSDNKCIQKTIIDNKEDCIIRSILNVMYKVKKFNTLNKIDDENLLQKLNNELRTLKSNINNNYTEIRDKSDEVKKLDDEIKKIKNKVKRDKKISSLVNIKKDIKTMEGQIIDYKKQIIEKEEKETKLKKLIDTKIKYISNIILGSYTKNDIIEKKKNEFEYDDDKKISQEFITENVNEDDEEENDDEENYNIEDEDENDNENEVDEEENDEFDYEDGGNDSNEEDIEDNDDEDDDDVDNDVDNLDNDEDEEDNVDKDEEIYDEIPYDIDEILDIDTNVYENDDEEENVEINVDKRKISLLRKYFVGTNINISSELFQENIEYIKNFKLPNKIKNCRINYFAFQHYKTDINITKKQPRKQKYDDYDDDDEDNDNEDNEDNEDKDKDKDNEYTPDSMVDSDINETGTLFKSIYKHLVNKNELTNFMEYITDHINTIYNEKNSNEKMVYINNYISEKYYNIDVRMFNESYNPFFEEILRLLIAYYSIETIEDEIMKKNIKSIDKNLYYFYQAIIADYYDHKINDVDLISKIQSKILFSNNKILSIIEMKVLEIIVSSLKHKLYIYNKPSLKEANAIEDEISENKEEKLIILWKSKIQEILDKENDIKEQILKREQEEGSINIIYDVDNYKYILYNDCQ